jgi:uncharacterized protein (DUF885 family)
VVDFSPDTRASRGLPVASIRVEGPRAWAEDAAFARAALKEAEQLASAHDLREDDRLTLGFLDHLLTGWEERGSGSMLGFQVTPYSSSSLGLALRLVFQGFQGSPETYLSLVADQRDQVAAYQDRLLAQREAGILIPRSAVAGTREALRRLREASAAVLPASAPVEAREHASAVVESELLPAYDALLAVLGEPYERDAPTLLGQGQYDGGEEHYRKLVRFHTASTLTPEELHQLGLEQVQLLTEQMAKARSDMGAPASESDFHAQLDVDPRVHATSPEDVDAVFRKHMERLQPRIGQWFSVLPRAPYCTERLPPESEAGMTYGYYEQPTAAKPRGTYYWNGANLESKSLLTYAALIFHELAPGHHFHIARQAENEALPDIRRYGIELTAFNEGWAEYAAGLGWEMGLYDEPLDGYGRLVHERFTAQRLVVDTGLNLYGWTTEQAAGYMKANTTESDAQVASEVVRYGTDLPGQALAYRAGFVELSRLRRRAENVLGDRFDVRAYHEEVLGPGALPFPVLDGHLERWAAQVSSGA